MLMHNEHPRGTCVADASAPCISPLANQRTAKLSYLLEFLAKTGAIATEQMGPGHLGQLPCLLQITDH